MIAAGLDACPGGWACVVLGDGRYREAWVPASAEAALRRWPEAGVFGVDIPIGLPESGTRRADIAARAFIGPRWQSVWLTPPRRLLDLPWSAGLGVSRQAHGMGRRIREIETVADRRFREVHPEVTFAHLAGGEPLPRKRTWTGLWRRHELLESVGVELPHDLALDAAPDDLVDAAAVAFSAWRIATGAARTLPSDPEPGEPAIWY